MKPEELKLYNKYKHINDSNTEFIYIGNDNENYYWFLYKNEDHNLWFSTLNSYGFDPNQIVEELNLEIIDINDIKYIKGYIWNIFSKKEVENYLKPNLKDKLNNIINR